MLWTVHKFDCPEHNPVSCSIGTAIFTFGGAACDRFLPIVMYVLDTVKLKWSQLELHMDQDLDCVPFRRYGYTAVSHDSKIYIWGGHSENRTCNTLFCFDSDTLKWSTPKVRGNIPESRYGHSACIIGNSMYIFGGLHRPPRSRQPKQYAQDLYRLDLDSMLWCHVQTNGTPPLNKDFHTATVIGNKMYVYGEPRRNDDQTQTSEMYYLDTVTSTWICPFVKEPKPRGRRGHSAFEHNGFLYIYGGFSRNFNSYILDVYLDDIDRYDPESSTWTKISPKGDKPCRRSVQTCQVINDKLFVSGGIFSSSPILELYGPPRGFDLNELIFDPISSLNDLHVLNLNFCLKDLCLLKVSKLIRRSRTNIADLLIPLSLKDDLANVNPSRNPNDRMSLFELDINTHPIYSILL